MIKKALIDHIIELAHVGYIVPNLREAVASFKRVYGIDDSHINITPPEDQEALTRFAFVDLQGTQVELIEPISDHFKTILLNSPMGGGGINHMAYIVDSAEAALVTLAEHGIKHGFVTPDGVVDLGAKKMVYLDPADTDNILIELIELCSTS